MPHIHPSATHLRDPAQLSFQATSTRRLIIASYWLLVLAALPLWWRLTSIERLALPVGRVSRLGADGKELKFGVRVSVDAELGQGLDALKGSIRPMPGVDMHVQIGNSDDPVAPTYRVKAHADAPQLSGRDLLYPPHSSSSSLAGTLSELLAASVDSHRVVPYSPRYRLAFSLLNEDAAAGQMISGWDISSAISRQMAPLLSTLSVLHNFTIESQVQFHAPLAFTPADLGNGDHGITPEDLSVFVNSADWTLSSSVSNDPVLHFIVFVPSSSRRPLRILDSNGSPSSSSAFLLPQWGGIVIHNPDDRLSHSAPFPSDSLNSVMSTFATQLLRLLGVPSLPDNVHPDPHSPILSAWQMDALLRRRALENARGAQDTLQSIIKLVDQIENMPVGQDVRGDVEHSLDALDQMHQSSPNSLNETLHQSADALVLSSRAFFNPGMLALLYFPAEHKYAVYTPLFASAFIPLVAATIKEFKAWRAHRRR